MVIIDLIDPYEGFPDEKIQSWSDPDIHRLEIGVLDRIDVKKGVVYVDKTSIIEEKNGEPVIIQGKWFAKLLTYPKMYNLLDKVGFKIKFYGSWKDKEEANEVVDDEYIFVAYKSK